MTPLHRAARGDHVHVVRFLLDEGADPSVRERNYNATPHDWAVHNGSVKAAKLLAD